MKLDDTLAKQIGGLYYGNRVLLPFHAEILKVIIENDIITDFSSNKKGAEYKICNDFTEIYFHDYPSLSDVITKFEMIKLVVVESGQSIFDFKNHRRIGLRCREKHAILIEELDEDILFIE